MNPPRILFIVFLLLFILDTAHAQTPSLFIPLNIQKAIDKGTRTTDGKPGPNYWQNKSDYKINVWFNPKTREVSGEEKIVYYNESPDTLKQIFIRLYHDIFRKGNMRVSEVNPVDIDNGVDVKILKINGKDFKMDSTDKQISRSGTNLIVTLEKPIAPKSKAEIETKWNFAISKETRLRMGMYDSTSFFVSYWYPQIAVYDDIDGWDTQSYTGLTEMYNDFNNYDVEISVPKNFLVWATGILQNADEIYPAKILERYKKSLTSNDVVRIVSVKDYESGLVTLNKDKITYRFKADYVPDFCFATSDHYLWDGSTLTVDKNSGRKTFIAAAYNPASKDFYGVAELARKAIESFSTQMPGRPFPYPCMTVFNGQGGMEYPMMVNDSSVPEVWETVHLTSHEISHTYFPFYMGINERKYAWMDEGMATMLPFDFQTENAPGYDPRSRNALSYSDFAGREEDVPPMVLSYNLMNPAYRTASYRRPGAAYEFLRQMLGDDLFKKCLHEYMNRWNGKHPIPWDFFFTFNEVSGQNLDWYFKPWFFETKYPDLSLSASAQSSGEIEIKISNIGGLPVPIQVKAVYDDGSKETIQDKNTSVWNDGKTYVDVKISPKKKIKKIELGNTQIPDVNLKNNVVEF
jgi:hypothetical protein